MGMGLVHSKSLGFSSGEWFNTDVGQLWSMIFQSFYIKFSNCYLQKNPIYLPDPHTKSPLEKENGFHSPHLTGVTSFSCHPPSPKVLCMELYFHLWTISCSTIGFLVPVYFCFRQCST